MKLSINIWSAIVLKWPSYVDGLNKRTKPQNCLFFFLKQNFTFPSRFVVSLHHDKLHFSILMNDSLQLL